MKKMMAMLLASVMAAGTFTTTAFAYTGDDVQKNTPVSTAAQETDAAESTNAGKTDNTDSIEIDPDMQVLPDGYEVSTDADGNLIVTVGGKEYNIGSEKSQKQMGTVVPGITSLHFRSGPGMDQESIWYLHSGDTVEIVEKYGDWYKVNFNGKTDVLKKIDIDLPYGKKVGIMGRTGCGKSVIMRLMNRFYDCTSGSITVDGKDISEYKLDDVRRSTSFVSQDVFLFSETVANNIAFYDEGKDMDKIEHFASLARVDKFVPRLTDGYDTCLLYTSPSPRDP